MWWLDIPHTEDGKYFEFNKLKFQRRNAMDSFVKNVDRAERRIVVITDPHVKNNSTYTVLSEGLALEKITDTKSANNIFVKRSNGDMFVAPCWPGNSVWVDFVNPNGREFWKK